MKKIIDYFVHRTLFVNLISVILIVAGIWIVANMNRDAFPSIDFEVVQITTVWGGASAQDVESLITRPLEEAVDEVDDIKEYRSTSLENISYITITIEPDAQDTQKVIDDIRSSVTQVNDLPDGTEDPKIQELSSESTPVIQWSIAPLEETKAPISYRELRDITGVLEDRFLEIDNIARVAKGGWHDSEIFVDLDIRRMQNFLVGTNDVVRAVRTSNINLPGGSIFMENKEVTIRTVSEYNKIEEIRRSPIRANEVGKSTNIGDVARVYEGFQESDLIETANSKNSISLILIKRSKGDIITIVDKSYDIVEAFKKEYGSKVQVFPVNDYSYYTKRRLSVLSSNAVLGFIFVLAILLLFLNWRIAIMVALGIPIAFGIALIIMDYTGVGMNLISMFGLILVLGIIVDDAVIVSENVYRYVEEGHEPMAAASKGTQEVFYASACYDLNFVCGLRSHAFYDRDLREVCLLYPLCCDSLSLRLLLRMLFYITIPSV